MNSIHKRLPPYGKALISKLSSGQKPQNDVYLFWGDSAWRYAKSHHVCGQSVLVLPDNCLPEQFRWPVQGLSVLVFDLHKSEVDNNLLYRLAWQLLTADAEIVRYVRTEIQSSLLVFYRDGQRFLKGELLCRT